MHHAGFAILASLLFANASAAAPVKLGQMEDGTTIYLVSSEGSGDLRQVRTLRVYPVPRTVGSSAGVRAEIDAQRVDCAARTYQTERIEWYDNPAATGTPLEAFDVPVALRETLVVRSDDLSVVGVIWRVACTGSTSVATPPQPAPAEPVPARPAQPAPSWPDQPAPAGPASPSPSAGPGGGTTTPTARAPGPQPSLPPLQLDTPLAPFYPNDSRGSISASHPFPESVFTLGTMGKLAHYVYFDREQFTLLAATAETMARAQSAMATGGVMKGLVDRAAAQNDKARRRYQSALAEKVAMLAREGLESEPLPKLGFTPISAFRAELYRHLATGQRILVFRGSQEALDWVSNLWLGVDLLGLEAPHYQAARELVERLVKSGRKPIVVGHSLGGGMAQYAGQLYDLKVVAFNSSPLPARYIPAKLAAPPKNVKLFSAIEYYDQPNNTVTRADPVSLRIPKIAERFAAFRGVGTDDNFIKAHRHLVLPVCVASRPQPFRTVEEDEELGQIINTMLYPHVMGYILTRQPGKAAMEKGMEAWINREVGRQLDTPAWQPASSSAFDQRVSVRAKKLVASAAIDEFHNMQAVAKMGKVLYNSAFGSMLKAAGTMGSAMAVAGARAEVGLLFMPHHMSRFNRGMQAEVGNDVFVARSITAQCQPPESTY